MAAQLRAENAKLKKAPGTSKALDVYRRTLYNEMLDNHVNLMKLNHKVIHRAPIEWYTHDNTFNPSIALLRAFGRRRMTKSPGKLEASKYAEEWHQAALGRLTDNYFALLDEVWSKIYLTDNYILLFSDQNLKSIYPR